MKVLVYLILTCLLLLLHAPLFEWWCGTGIGHLLGGMKPSAFADTVAMVLLMISCGAISELPERLEPFEKLLAMAEENKHVNQWK